MPRVVCPAFPEVLEAAAQYGAAEGDNRIRTSHGPVHACALEPGADGELASCLDDARGGA